MRRCTVKVLMCCGLSQCFFSMKGTFLLDDCSDPSCFLCPYGNEFILLSHFTFLSNHALFVDFPVHIVHLDLAGLFLFFSFLLPFYFSLACGVLRSGWFIDVVGFGEVELKDTGCFFLFRWSFGCLNSTFFIFFWF